MWRTHKSFYVNINKVPETIYNDLTKRFPNIIKHEGVCYLLLSERSSVEVVGEEGRYVKWEL